MRKNPGIKPKISGKSLGKSREFFRGAWSLCPLFSINRRHVSIPYENRYIMTILTILADSPEIYARSRYKRSHSERCHRSSRVRRRRIEAIRYPSGHSSVIGRIGKHGKTGKYPKKLRIAGSDPVSFQSGRVDLRQDRK